MTCFLCNNRHVAFADSLILKENKNDSDALSFCFDMYNIFSLIHCHIFNWWHDMSSIKNGNVMFRNLKLKVNVHAGINKITLTAYMINEWQKNKTKEFKRKSCNWLNCQEIIHEYWFY